MELRRVDPRRSLGRSRGATELRAACVPLSRARRGSASAVRQAARFSARFKPGFLRQASAQASQRRSGHSPCWRDASMSVRAATSSVVRGICGTTWLLRGSRDSIRDPRPNLDRFLPDPPLLLREDDLSLVVRRSSGTPKPRARPHTRCRRWAESARRAIRAAQPPFFFSFLLSAIASHVDATARHRATNNDALPTRRAF